MHRETPSCTVTDPGDSHPVNIKRFVEWHVASEGFRPLTGAVTVRFRSSLRYQPALDGISPAQARSTLEVLDEQAVLEEGEADADG